MSAAEASLLVAEGLTRRFGARTALAPLDFELGHGETVALVGPNGAGKSTLLSLLAGALQPSAGTVRRSPQLRTGWAPQRPALYGRLSARENLVLFARLEGEGDPRAASERLLQRLALPTEDRPAGDLSVGMQQRLNIALALLGDPSVLLLDEPAASLDPEGRERLWELLAARREDGRSLVFSSQDLHEVERFADRVAVLRDGALTFSGAKEDWAETLAAVTLR